jgi:hypothetical protein
MDVVFSDSAFLLMWKPRPFQIPAYFAQLLDKIEPFSIAHPVEKLSSAHFSECGTRELALLLMKKIPELKVREKITLWIAETGMQLVRFLLLFHRPFSNVLEGETSNNKQDVS